jgi:putative ubiquitin-RnfH superfamily antitoxin RatB of RatAB toxin-antitoxin module
MDRADSKRSTMHIVVAYAEPGVEAQVDVAVAPGATVAHAVTASGLITRFELKPPTLAYAIFGQRVRAETPLADGDRVELLRPLAADPKDSRRRRARENSLSSKASEPKGPRRGG